MPERRSVRAGVGGEVGQASEWATLSAEDAGPEGGAIGNKRIVGFRVDHEPGLLRELLLKLSGAPP